MSHSKIVVAGAGSVGCFVGGMLARGTRDVTLLVRPHTAEELTRQGLSLTDYAGLDVALAPDGLTVDTQPECLATATIILVTVKSGATATMAQLIAQHAPKEAVVVSLQNGVKNAEVLRAALPDHDVRAGMVPFNVVWVGGGRFHRGTSGDILIARGRGHVARHLSVLDMGIHERRDMTALQWGKLVVNLNNGLNALSGVPLRQQIGDIRWRRLMAAQMDEALTVLKARDVAVRNPVAKLPMRFVPSILRLPNGLFRVIARTMLQIDPTARSSMWEDLERGRSTEIDELQGQIVGMAAEAGVSVPVNACIAQLIAEVSQASVAQDAPPTRMTAQDVRRRMRAARA